MEPEIQIYCLNDVPDELLLEMFNCFDGASLKTLSLVCKRWSQIIGQSASTMRRLPLSTRAFFDGPGEIMRKYRSVNVNDLHDEDTSVFEEIGPTCKELTIRNTTLRDPNALGVIFSVMTSLRKVFLVRVRLTSNDQIIPTDVALTLTKLRIHKCDHRILGLFPKLQVQRLEITDGDNRIDNEALGKFLSQQEILESMWIQNLADNASVLCNNDPEFNFKLKELSTLFFNIRDMGKFDKNFISFLEVHRESLKKLKVHRSLSPTILKFIISTFNWIQELEINASQLPQESSFYDPLKPNLSMNSLKLNGTINQTNFNGVKGMLFHYKNIERVSVADTDVSVENDLFHVMSVRLAKLNHLSVLYLHKSFTPDTIFSSLKYFSIGILNNITQWKAFITRNESLESINVGCINRNQFTEQLIQEIITLPNLRHLKFGGPFTACKQVYDVIKANYKNLQTLKLMVRQRVNRDEEIRNLTFVFPANKSFWMPQCSYFDDGSDREPLKDAATQGKSKSP